MALWNKVLSGFDAEDETVNFGARAVAESYDSIYETTTLATIQTDGEVVENPKVVASVQNFTLCVAIDKSITIFNDKSCQEIRLSVSFDSLITSYCMSKNSNFLLVATNNGTLYCLDIDAGGQLVFSRNVIQSYQDSGEVILKVFFQDCENGSADLLLVTSEAHIYKVSGFDEKFMDAALDESDIGRLELIGRNIDCHLLFRENDTSKVHFIEVGFSFKQQSVVMIGEGISIWPIKYLYPLNNLPYKYVKVQYFKSRRFLLGLRTDGALSIICSSTLLSKKVWDGPASDMLILEDEAEAETQILILLKAQDDSSTTFLQLVSFPDFQVKFNLQVAKTTYLVDSDDGLIDEIVFLEGAGKTLSAIDTIKVKAVEENLPECRLQRLLRRCKYEEAEIFAHRFHLSTDAINYAKAVSLAKKVNSIADDNGTASWFNELFTILDKIKNVDLIFECCHNTITSEFEQTRQLVSYARERLIKDSEKTNDDLIVTYLSILNNTLLKIETYEMIHRTKEKTDISNRHDISNWTQFSNSDLLQECKNYLITGELKVAALIWVRHSSTLLARITMREVRYLLEAIPNGLSQPSLWPWLFHFVPSLLSVYPDGLSEIVTWGYERAKSFERCDQENWPENGLEFCNELMKLLNFKECESFFHLQQQYVTKHSPLQHLTAVIQALADLKHLKRKHRLMVKIDAYMGEPIEVANLLLHKVCSQEVCQFITDFLHQYMMNNSLKNDHVLILYIQKTLRNSKGWWFWEEAPWEQKIANIIGCIHNVENRLQQTLDTLKKASVPWSSTMLALVETSTSIKHPLVSAIVTERTLVGTKLILKKYDYQCIGVTDNLIKYIIQQNRDEMLQDLYEVTENNHSLKIRALSFCVNYFLNKGDLERTMTVINSQTDEDAVYCCKEIVNYISVFLRFKEMNNTAEYYREVIGAVENKLRTVLSISANNDTLISEDILSTAAELKTICLLRKEFGIKITLTEYQDEKETILQNHIKHSCEELTNGRLTKIFAYKKAQRIADLLGFPQILAVCYLLQNTCDIEILNYYIEAIRDVGYFPAGECPHVKRLCEICLFDLKGRELEALSKLRDISVSTLENCSIGEVSKTLLPAVWANLSHRLIGNESMDKIMTENGTADKNKWRLHRIYGDTTMCSNQMILPLFKESFKFHSRYTDEKQFKSNFDLSEEKNNDRITDIVTEINSISMESYDFPLLQILNSLMSYSCFATTVSKQIATMIQPTREGCLRTLLQKIISARTFDLQSGLSCLYMLSEQDAFKWFTSASKIYQTDYSRLRAISDLGYEYSRSIGNKPSLNYFKYYRICDYWVQELHDYGIHHKEILTSDTEGKQQILEQIIRAKKSQCIELLNEFCTDFEFDFDECYILYVEVFLKQWNPTTKLVMLDGEKALKINEDEVEALHKTCRQVVSLIEDKSAMRKHLATLWSKINFYHYEVFLLIMELLEDTNEQRLSHFCFLQNYVRFGPPTRIEYEEWSQLCPENNSLPAISKWRLPFLPKIDQWKLITPELNLSTYEKWLEVATILNLQVHVICSLAIKGSVTQVWESTDEAKKRNSNEWLIHSKNSTLLEDIKACIKHMPDQDALYYGTAVLYYVVNHTPPSADQAAAAQECYAYAQKWAQASVQSDEAMIEKIKYKYLQLTTKHILHVHGLGNDEYLQLAFSPERLVRQLYLDPSIVLRSRGATQNRPDINSAVNALGKIFSLNVIQLRLELLDEWLQPSGRNCKLDESFTCNIVAASSETEDSSIDDDNLLRACYILECDDKFRSANYLINIGFGVKNEASFRPGIQFRALHVLLSITDSATVENLTKRDLPSIKEHMKSLQYVSDMERLGFTFSVDRFQNSPRLELAQTLFKSHPHLPEALVLIIRMCIDYDLKNYTLWDETLKAMAKMQMVKELKRFLPKVLTVNHAVGCSGYIKGWEVIIWEPFRRTDALLSEKQFDECVTSICLLHSCPVAVKLNLERIIKTCFASHRPELAAALLPFLTKNDANFVIEKISRSCKVSKVIEDLRALSTKGILTVSYSVRMLEELSESNSKERCLKL